MNRVAASFNRSVFARVASSPVGRALRVAFGAAMLVGGFVFRGHPAGLFAMTWSALPISGGLLDLCFTSAFLGGPLSGRALREWQRRDSGA